MVALAWPRPDFDAATREFLIGLLSTACWQRIVEPEAWEDWWLEPPDAATLEACWSPFAHVFVLDGDGPRFMQDLAELDDGAAVDVGALLIDAPGANTLKKNADLFVKRGGIGALSRAAAAMALFTLQAFAPAGGAGHRTSLRGGGPMTTLVLPRHPDPSKPLSLWHQLWLNVDWYEDWGDPINATMPLFPWCAPTRSSENKRNTTPQDVHPAQAYWGMPRRIRLEFEANDAAVPCDLTGAIDQVVVRAYRTRPSGHNYEGWSQAHPLTPYYRVKPGDAEWLPLHPQPGRLGYRDWLGLIVSDQADGGTALRMPAKIVKLAGQRLREVEWPRRARLLATGYDMDNMKARGFVESEMPVLLLEETFREPVEILLRQLIGGAREAERLLSYAVGLAIAGREMPGTDKGARNLARDRFWTETEGRFLGLAEALPNRLQAAGDAQADAGREIRQEWLEAVQAAAFRIFDELVPMDAIEEGAIERLVRARRQLSIALRGYNRDGGRLFDALALPPPPSRKKEKRAA